MIHHLERISCPIYFVWMCGGGGDTAKACLRSASDPERPIVAAEMRSRPYLVLVETQPYFIIGGFHAPASPDNLLHLQAPWLMEALIQPEDVRGQDAGVDAQDDNSTCLCNFPHLCLLLLFISPFPPQQPENGTRIF